MEYLLNMSLRYGLNLKSTHLLSSQFKIDPIENDFKYFRYITKNEPLPHEKHQYTIRIENGNFLLPSLWLFRFQNHLILIINFFNLNFYPINIKINDRGKTKPLPPSSSPQANLRRIKFSFLTRIKTRNPRYIF